MVDLTLSWDLQRTRGSGVDEGIWNNGCDWISSAESGVKGGAGRSIVSGGICCRRYLTEVVLIHDEQELPNPT